jgi:hypothetical protein
MLGDTPQMYISYPTYTGTGAAYRYPREGAVSDDGIYYAPYRWICRWDEEVYR